MISGEHNQTTTQFPPRRFRPLIATGALGVSLSLLAACSSTADDAAESTTSETPVSSSMTPPPSAEQQPEVPAAELAPKLLAVGVTDYASAEAAIDAGVRHLFFGTGADWSILNGQGEPERSVASLEKRAGEPLIISVDEEGGLVQRLADIIGELPSPRDMAATMSPEEVHTMMAEHGRKMADLGITVDFAPSVDLDGAENVSDNAIGSRAFSADPQVVIDYARAYAQGLLDAGITPVIKHFPGHGHASGDSHTGAVTVPPVEELMQADFLPYQELANMPGVEVMVSHLQSPGLNPDTPGSISPAVYDLLRDGWEGFPGYEGIIYTDDLTGMQAITDQYSGPESVVAALSAGADQALAAAGGIDVAEAIRQVTEAIDSGEIARDHAEQAVEKLQK